MSATWSTTETPVGPFSAVLDADGAVLAAGWTAALDTLLPQVHRSLRPTAVAWVNDLGAATAAVHAYHRGELGMIDAIVVRQRSGVFLGHAWDTLRLVPAGKPVTYTELAALAGRPLAVRAAASACARNAVALFVPCHRVVRTGGALGGFRWGTEIKAWLIGHEGATIG